MWKESELSKTVPVRPDGMITLPLVGEIKAVGLTPDQLKEQLTSALQKVVSDPQVTVMVVSVNSLSFNIMGNVNRPGYYPLTRPMTILDAIALSGGFRDFAKQKKIYVLRAGPNGVQEKTQVQLQGCDQGQEDGSEHHASAARHARGSVEVSTSESVRRIDMKRQLGAVIAVLALFCVPLAWAQSDSTDRYQQQFRFKHL